MQEIEKQRNLILIAIGTGLAVSLLLIAVLAFAVGPGFDNRSFDLDMALLEMYTRHAVDGRQALGPYSRFGWNHPGPVYFYLLAPLYWLSGDSSTSMFLTARIMNLLSALCLLGTLYAFTRESGPLTTAWSSLVTLLYVVYLGAGLVCSPWNPWIVIFPSALFMVCCAACATGKPLFLPAVVATGSFLVQTHVALLCLVGAVAFASLVLLLFRPGAMQSHGRAWKVSAVLSLILALLMWAPPLLEEAANHPGNLSKLLQFFQAGSPGHTPGEAFAEVSRLVAWLPLLPIRWLPFRVPDFEYACAGQVFALLQLGLLPLAAWIAHREHRPFQARLAILGTVGLVASFWAAMHVQGGLFGYLVTWTSAIGLVNWIVLGSVALDRFADAGSRRLSYRSPWVAAVFVGLMGLTVATHLPRFFTQAMSVPDDAPPVKHLSEALIEWAGKKGIRRPVIHFDWNNWSLESGIVLQLHKAGIPFAVLYTWPNHGQSDWPLLLGRRFKPGPEDKVHIVFRTSDAGMEPPWEPIAAYRNHLVYGKDIRGDER